jgi:CxxC motif-containing protein (DUF1111 family)
MRKLYVLGLFGAGLFGLAACQKIFTTPPADDQILDGPVEGLTTEQNAQFLAGDKAFNDEIFTAEKGLGPFFVATSCGSCHAGDGKGHPFSTLTRFGQSDTFGNIYMHNGGPQLQPRCLPGYIAEVLPSGCASARFTPPANTGLGFLAALTDDQILANADPHDENGDGISGVPNYIQPPHYFQPQNIHHPLNGRYIGRFGKKAAAITLLHQTVNAYVQDMGITSEYAMDEPGIYNGTSPSPDEVPDPEVAGSTVRNVVFYLRTLKAPIQRNTSDAQVQAGNQLFNNLNCNGCHKPEFTTGTSDIAALSNKKFFPYTDLLLHDMGSGLDDGYTEGIAQASEWRTPALWGLGLSKNSQGGQYFLMHDGRAHSIEEAILIHGGEALRSRNAYQALSQSDKDALMNFLESL